MSLLAFSLGVLAAGIAAMATYYSHFKNVEVIHLRVRSAEEATDFGHEIEDLRLGVARCNRIASTCGLCSLLLFFVGILLSFLAFLVWKAA